MKTRYLFGLPFVTLNIGNKEVDAIIDTGFSAELVLPQNIIEELNLKLIGELDYTLADGDDVTTKEYFGKMLWFNNEKEISIISTKSPFALIGMELLHNVKLTLEPSKETILLEKI